MQRKLFIGIDLQDGFLTDEIRSSNYERKVIDFLAAMPHDAVVLSRFVNTPNSNFVSLLNWPDMQAGDTSTQLFGELEASNFLVVEKASYTAWLPQVVAKAQAVGATEIVLFGLDSDACVLKTALDVFEAGLIPIVLTDLCESSSGTERHETGLKLLGALIGERQLTTSNMMPGRA